MREKTNYNLAKIMFYRKKIFFLLEREFFFDDDHLHYKSKGYDNISLKLEFRGVVQNEKKKKNMWNRDA